MKKIKLEISGLSYSQAQTGAYALVLGEQGGTRRLPIIIGGYEAQAIAVELESMTPSRPLTHDLFKNFATAYGIHVDEIIIYNLKEGVFFSKLMCNNGQKQLEIDARTSDAIALAVRFNCPIYTYEFIISQAGVIVDDETIEKENEGVKKKDDKPKPVERKKKAAISSSSDYSSLTLEELNEALTRAIDDENYETASKLRDELNRRKS
jgi:bifunctional DNase/RNase